MADFSLSLVDKVTGPSNSIINSLSKVGESGGDAAGGLAEMVDPMTAIAAVAGAVVIGLGALAFKGAELALEMGELREKTLATFSALGGGKAAGAATLQMLDDLRASTGMTRADLTPLATQLMGMGIQGAALKAQLTALASVKAIGVDGGTEEYLQILKKISGQSKVSSKDLANLYKTGVNVDDIAGRMGVSVKALKAGLANGTINAKKFGAALQDAVTAKGADALASQAANLTNQIAIAKENFMQLFEGVDARPFLDALKPVLEIFSQSTASGRAMKFMITTVFNGIFAIASKVLPYIKMFVLQLVIGFLKLYISMKPTIKHFQELFAQKKGGEGLAKAVKWVADNIVLTVKAIANVIASGLSFYEKAMGWWDAINGKIQGTIAWFESLWASIKSIFSGGSDIASGFVDGLIGGIKDGVAKVVDAAKNLGKSALDGAKSALGIHSPSKAMMALGGHTAGGFAQGISAGASDVADASSGLGSAAMSGAMSPVANTPPSAGGGAKSSKSVSITVEAGAIVIGGGAGAQENLELFEQQLSLVLERVALSQGLGGEA